MAAKHGVTVYMVAGGIGKDLRPREQVDTSVREVEGTRLRGFVIQRSVGEMGTTMAKLRSTQNMWQNYLLDAAKPLEVT